jgi:hypothetical protein
MNNHFAIPNQSTPPGSADEHLIKAEDPTAVQTFNKEEMPIFTSSQNQDEIEELRRVERHHLL